MNTPIYIATRIAFLIFIISCYKLYVPNFRNIFNDVIERIKKCYRVNLNQEKRKKLLWKDLIKLHKNENWNYTIHDNTWCMESLIQNNKNQINRYFYSIYKDKFYSQVKVIYDFPEDLTTNLFILATHINNILNEGIIHINIENKYIEYSKSENIIVPLIHQQALKNQIILHYSASQKIQWAFEELINRNEEPVLIFAELMILLDQEDVN